jgi:hypothetical protein
VHPLGVKILTKFLVKEKKTWQWYEVWKEKHFFGVCAVFFINRTLHMSQYSK